MYVCTYMSISLIIITAIEIPLKAGESGKKKTICMYIKKKENTIVKSIYCCMCTFKSNHICTYICTM